MSSVRSVSTPLSQSRVPASEGSDLAWAQYTSSLAQNRELFRGNWYYEPPGEHYSPIKGRSHGDFKSRTVSATWGLQDMDWWNRMRGGTVYGPSKYGSCAGMM